MNTEEEGMEKPGNMISSTVGLAKNTDDIATLCAFQLAICCEVSV